VEQLTFGGNVTAVPCAPRPAAAGYELERQLAACGAHRVAGVDEVGRGAWAGPVTVCAVVVRPGFPAAPDGLTDSKRVAPHRREAMAGELASWVEAFAIGQASAAEIDARGMTAALRQAAVSALEHLPHRPDAVLLDGAHDYIGRPWPVRCAVQADLWSVSVAGTWPAWARRNSVSPAMPGIPRPPTSARSRRTAQRRTTGCPGPTSTTCRNGGT
jgi:ribonuclease HII